MVSYWYHFLRRLFLRKDIQEWISPITLRHIKRYEFAKDYLVGCKLLDIACGTGYGVDILSIGKQIDYIGVDIDKDCIRYAKKNYKGKVTYICSSIYKVYFEPESFHTIVSFETLEHLEHPVSALKLFGRWLCHNGRLILSIPLNHPDRVYHRKVYTYADVKELFNIVGNFNIVAEYQQKHLSIVSVKDGMLNERSDGTYLGVWEKK